MMRSIGLAGIQGVSKDVSFAWVATVSTRGDNDRVTGQRLSQAPL